MADLSSDYQDKGSAYDMCISHSSSNRTIWENDRGHGVIVSNRKVYYVNGTSKKGLTHYQGIDLDPSGTQGKKVSSTFDCSSIKYTGKYGVEESEYVSGASIGEYYFSGGTFRTLWKMETQGNTRVLIHYEQKDNDTINRVIYR